MKDLSEKNLKNTIPNCLITNDFNIKKHTVKFISFK